MIANLTDALGKQKQKQDVIRSFAEWKLAHVDKKREVRLPMTSRCCRLSVGVFEQTSRATLRARAFATHVGRVARPGGVRVAIARRTSVSGQSAGSLLAADQ